MFISTLNLTNFRSYETLSLNLKPGPTTFIGNNGSGKTNIAESLIYLSFLSSHRVANTQPLIKLGADQAIIRSQIERDNRSLKVDLEINANKANRAQLNGNPTKSQREILGALQCIYFSPEDLDIVRGDPAIRRDFLDKLLITQTPRIAGVIADYERAVKQRNTLLKTRAPESALIPWTEQLIKFGAELTAERVKLVDDLAPFVAEHYKNLNEAKSAHISYKSNTENLTADAENNSEVLFARAKEVVKQEIDRGVSLIGPHRDDLYLHLGEFPAKGYASHGESWSMAIALRVGSFSLLKSEGADPVLILDDIFAELDTSRREHLISVTTLAEQTIITSAVENELPSELLSEKYYVTPGTVSQEAI